MQRVLQAAPPLFSRSRTAANIQTILVLVLWSATVATVRAQLYPPIPSTQQLLLSFSGGTAAANCTGSSNNSGCTTQQSSSFACNYDRPGGLQSGAWNDGVLNFTDPQPPSANDGWVLVQLSLQLSGRFDCNQSAPSATVQLGTLGPLPLALPPGPAPSGCLCPGCGQQVVEWTSPLQGGGWPGFVYQRDGANNTLQLTATGGTALCVSTVNLTLTYWAVNPLAYTAFGFINPTGGPTNTAPVPSSTSSATGGLTRNDDDDVSSSTTTISSSRSRGLAPAPAAAVGGPALEPTVVKFLANLFPDVLYRCYFGNPSTASPTDVVYNELNQTFTCLVPPSSVPVVVNFYLEIVVLGQYINPMTYTYYEQPVISAIFPSSGSPAGYETVGVAGWRFVALPQPTLVHCSFNGGEVAGSVIINDSYVNCETSPGVAGANVPLTVSLNGQQYTNALTFTYTGGGSPPPPPAGPPSGEADSGSLLPGWLWVCLVFGGATALVGVVVVVTRRCTRGSSHGADGAQGTRADEERQSLLHRGSDGTDGSGGRLDAGGGGQSGGGGGGFVKQLDISEVKLLERIGKGTFGEVYRGIWNGTEVGVKFLSSSNVVNVNDDQFLADFRREVTIMRACRHPCVVQFLGAGTDPTAGGCCIVMEYLAFGSLYKILHDESIRLDLEMIRKMLTDAARGMNYLHKSDPVIIHRDLKSHNLLVDENWKVKVSDFGLSKICETAADFASMTACGTPSWTAPEILRNENYTEKADVYSFGIVLWECMTREDPYAGMPPFQVVLSVGTKGIRPAIPTTCPVNWARLIDACWAEVSSSRPSIDEVLLRLDTELSDHNNLLITVPL